LLSSNTPASRLAKKIAVANHGHYGETRGVRYNPDIGDFELKCDDCVGKRNTRCYWPLTLDFWNPRTMQRCRACDVERRARLQREKRKADAVFAEAERQRNRTYYKENKAVMNMKHTLYMRGYRKGLAKREAVG